MSWRSAVVDSSSLLSARNCSASSRSASPAGYRTRMAGGHAPVVLDGPGSGEFAGGGLARAQLTVLEDGEMISRPTTSNAMSRRILLRC